MLTPANADEHPFAEFVGGVGEYDGCVQVAAFPKHPEEVGDMEVVIHGCDHTTPQLDEMKDRSRKIRNRKVVFFFS